MIPDGISSIIVAFIVLGIIIVIHELGHFLVAKFFKIRVETFSIGFGPRLVGFRRGETDYRISVFPLGGYVKMAGENPTDAVTGAPHEFLSKPKWQRFLVAVAGPAMNVVLAVVLLTGLYMYGSEVAASAEGQAIVGTVDADSPAQKAGIQSGDRILSIDGKDEPNWEEVEARVLTNAGRNVTIVLDRNGKSIQTSFTPTKKGPNETGYAGLDPIIVTNVIEYVEAGSPAQNAGLEPGDEIAAVNGVDAHKSGTVVKRTIQTVSEGPVPLTIIHKGQARDVSIVPTIKENERRIGVAFKSPTIMIKEPFGKALNRAIDKNVEYGTLIFKVLGRLIQRDLPMKAVDGPIGIVRLTGQFYDAGFAPLIQLMAMISLNLGFMNLLPIPILDGGVMLLLLIESLMGRDISLALKERIVQVSFVFLLTLMVFVLYNDVIKMLPPERAFSMKVFRPEMQVLIEYLRENALKVTPHRELILDAFLDNEGHRSVEDIYRTVREQDPRVGYTTVYRTMKLLVECGLAREIDLADGITRYEHLFNHQHHDHMICMECGHSIEFLNPEIESLQDAASEQLGFKVFDHKLQIYGVCRDCRKATIPS